jgi:IS1 family transposase
VEVSSLHAVSTLCRGVENVTGICAPSVHRPAQEFLLDEISARPAAQPRSPWIFNALEVGSRYWAAAVVGRRTRRTTKAFVVQLRQACATIPMGLVITSDPFPYYLREIERSFGASCIYAHVHTDYRQNCVVRTNAIMHIGSRERLDLHLSVSEDSKRPNTAYVERLNLFLRRSCSYLHRRTSGRVRNPERLASAVGILRCSYNFIRPHARLRVGALRRTPAMFAGCFDRPLTWRSVFAWPLPPKRPADVLRDELKALAPRRRRREPTLRLTSLGAWSDLNFGLLPEPGT